ncbi:hypothetical protein M5J14_16660 [Lysinibacillus sp. OL1_EC]|uniref:hypothetical protein n=1 Tax=unclassified Lysinibacillus TaxID=2636778 RepID=UPI00187D3A44|nr:MULTISPECIES: hypothetical protein [unclassified Lysinibacillus]MCM0626128.1 hypothetical protein [Lysinibacillus sp. OL1_EC]MCS5501531.1 hypothetical protein [Lysinibacillus sp. A4]UKJ43709.1 hypothetical protein L6W14_13110 [Lysinibacillus sp. ACHW1.5]WGT40198.1 hypothetical protein QH639_05315 [Lysinibacillus sp. 1 U-2021]
MLKNKTINRIFVKGENGFLLQATCFPVGNKVKVFITLYEEVLSRITSPPWK